MKYYFLLITLLSISSSFSQTFDEDLHSLVEAEAKSASNRIYTQRVNLNTGNYDVIYHKLEFTVDPSVASILGVVTTHFVAKENMTEVTFDLADNMIVSQVLQNGNALTYVQNTDDELVITLQTTVNTGQTGIVEITYSGNPISSGFGSFAQTTHNSDPIIWTLSEPYGAKGWWPCKQDLNDKIENIDVYITTPQFNAQGEEYIAVSNGVEQSQTLNGASKTTHYKHEFPIPAYLIAIAATNYEVYSHTVPNNGNPFEIVNYVYPEDFDSVQESTAVTVDIMELFSTKFEEYPYASEKYGHAQFGWGGGMEHTTVSFMGSFGRSLIAHELAHQWFGDKITCGSWKDIWLNEGFATYLSGLVIEDFDGEESFKSWKQGRVNSITSQTDGAVYLADTDTTSVGRIFSSRLSYNKGAMVLHMLRKKVGDADFYQGMQDYLSDSNLAYNYAKTPDYIEKLEAASGQDLTEFFNDWIYNEGYPSYTINANWINTNQLQFQVNQTQSDGSVSYFEVPIPIRIMGTNGEVLDIVLDNTFSGETFVETVNFTISEILFDPDVDLISKNNNLTLNTNTFEIARSLLMYPNPTTSYIKLEKPDALTINTIQIFDVLGKLVLEMDYRETINTENLSSGVHFVKFSTNQGVFHKRLLKD
ncbi:T9SS type A sorting domain-containing protein [Lacinutrix sp. WUR7]|uniref:M1 family aminopeptidase n=1 Tax=Lacinutrix sp. WUR7 TaxID=2653681 RepID=UPI00193D3039|nr:M1 family aminopeptidase [Lacinutrix sp. WUR7]QRM88825.1 T9SS type A sorting domain-containing protein [Lacinutrix sp. WUR7]